MYPFRTNSNLSANPFRIRSYQVCGNPLEGIGARFRVSGNGIPSCSHLYFNNVYGNPPIWFDEDHAGLIGKPVVALDAGTYSEVMTQYFFKGITEMLHVTIPLNEAQCNITKDSVDGFPERLVVGRTVDGDGKEDYWVHTSTFRLQNNDLSAPTHDGGKHAVELTKIASEADKRYRSFCSSVPRTFLNEDSCILSDDACYREEGKDVDIDLTEENLKKIYDATGGMGGDQTKYVYAITLLRNEPGQDLENPLMEYPCTPGARSRWIISTNCTILPEQEPLPQTDAIFRNLLSTSTDTNPYVRDVFFPKVGASCPDPDDTGYDFKIKIGNICFENTHPDNYQVHDMTYWYARWMNRLHVLS